MIQIISQNFTLHMYSILLLRNRHFQLFPFCSLAFLVVHIFCQWSILLDRINLRNHNTEQKTIIIKFLFSISITTLNNSNLLQVTLHIYSGPEKFSDNTCIHLSHSFHFKFSVPSFSYGQLSGILPMHLSSFYTLNLLLTLYLVF
jgi:hypothetical protein